MIRSLHQTDRCRAVAHAVFVLLCYLGFSAERAFARPKFRDAFFTVYPSAVGTVLDDVPSNSGHCGVCHFDFNGGGTRNPHGIDVGNALPLYPNNAQGYQDAIWSIRNNDPDGDGYSTFVEVTDITNYTNTPTFPGLTPGNVGSATNVSIADIQDFLVPSSGGDTTPPVVTVIAPNGGEVLTANTATTVQWTATDDSGISGVSLYVSLDNGATYSPVALGISNSGSHQWFPANRPTTTALFLVEAIDNAFNTGEDTSNSAFTIQSPPGGIVPTTLRDFDMPGSQPFDAGILNPPEACAVCHGNYDANVEPYYNWQGSMMAHASRDLLFEAALAIANQDAPDSGDLCLRCHLARGWLRGRSVPTDGSEMLVTDAIGVACDLCHRLVDPIPNPANPSEDTAILNALALVPLTFGTGMYVIDPTGARRGPFADADSGHPILVSPFHREAALCGTCHNVSNPAFEKDVNGNYVPNALDAPASDFSANIIAPVERTYSEWLNSEYNTPTGVYAPEFGGNKDYVAACQDCHMRDVTGQGCNLAPPVRNDLPLHDMTGGSTWFPGLRSTLFRGEVNDAAIQAGIARARYMLQNAAEMDIAQNGPELIVTITNNTGHKLPTGYPEGRRAWLNIKFFDNAMALVGESGAYDSATGVLSHDPEAKIYEILPATSGIPGVPDETEFHFVLNNSVLKDNRIPPRGFTNAAFANFGGPPVAYSYADGQYWDDTVHTIPPTATSAEVTLYYQSTSKEFVEFLLAENSTNSKGQELYDLWNNNGKCPPELMSAASFTLQICTVGGDCDDGLYCNGLEVCTTGFCAPGIDPCPGQGCDEVSDTCYSLGCNDNSTCEQGEDCVTCPNDCFSAPGGTCGDGICSGENASNCPVDCDPTFVPPSPTCCGDGTCEGTESDVNCAVNCATCTVDAECDDGFYCNGPETCDIGTGNCLPGIPVDCTDGVACTIDACNESTDTCDHTPNHTLCDNGLFCDGVETCDGVQGCLAGTIPCTTECEHCDEDLDSCVWCMLDIDGSTSIGTGDFAMFSACFGNCYAPDDPCWSSNFSGDPEGCVGTADFAIFANCFGATCGECASCAGPPLSRPSDQQARVTSSSGPMVSLRVVVVDTPTATEFLFEPPQSLRSLRRGDDFYVELWATRSHALGEGREGIAGLYVDVTYDQERASVVQVAPSTLLPLFSSRAEVDVARGRISRAGGCASMSDRSLGLNGNWVRVSTIHAQADRTGPLAVNLVPSAAPFGIVLHGEADDLDSTLIRFEGTRVLVLGKSNRSANLRAATR